MPSQDSSSPDLLSYTRSPGPGPGSPRPPGRHRRILRFAALALPLLSLLLVLAALGARVWMRRAMTSALPQIDGSLSVPGLHAPVTVSRDIHGVPSLRASSLDDLILAQGYVTAQDRLFQMDTLRRHAAGELAEILGSALLAHDRQQRLLQMRAAADRAVAQLPPDQLHTLELYAQGVNAAMAGMHDHLPVEFRLLNYRPRPWTPRDTLLISLVMFEDLSDRITDKLNREAITARLATGASPDLRAQLLADLYPVGSWRDHPPSQPVPDLTAPVEDIPDIPLDPSQIKLPLPVPPRSTVDDLLALTRSLAPSPCPGCQPGSNNWVVAGSHTASGAPLLSNDMHLSLTVPGLWYAINLDAPSPTGGDPFHVGGVSLPGAPFVIVGHNAHVAWGFTNLGADVQDLYLEHLRGSGASTEFQSPDGSWRPVLHQKEVIRVRGSNDRTLDVLATVHGNTATPILSPMLASEQRSLALRWVVYDRGVLTNPYLAINSATDAASLVRAFADFTGPAQNLVYADDGGHIGYHATGRIPLRGSAVTPSPISPVPTDPTAPDGPTHEWAGYIPYDQLPLVTDPPGGLLATANARITPDAYPFPITNDWSDPYRNERIWKLLSGRQHLTPADLLAVQGDITSDPDRVIAQRLAYALDHATVHTDSKRLHQAADLLRGWDGRLTSNSAAAAIVDSTRTALWPLILTPRLASPNAPRSRAEPWQLYTWGERAFAEEQLIVHTPARWLPAAYPTWDDLLAAAVNQGLSDSGAPSNLARWSLGKAHPLEINHPLFGQSPTLARLVGIPTGVHSGRQSGDGTTIKQVGRSFGPSERFTADLVHPDASTLNLVLGQAEDPLSPWFLDQFPAWLNVTTFPMPSTPAAIQSAATHTLTLTPR